jgi:outer membrane PBP1 activator LpoA protein
MGFDAYRLMQGLYSADTFWPLDGMSGSLSVDADGRIRRALPFAQFQNGRPNALPESRALDSDGLIGAR